jgi:hypothetical protein
MLRIGRMLLNAPMATPAEKHGILAPSNPEEANQNDGCTTTDGEDIDLNVRLLVSGEVTEIEEKLRDRTKTNIY